MKDICLHLIISTFNWINKHTSMTRQVADVDSQSHTFTRAIDMNDVVKIY